MASPSDDTVTPSCVFRPPRLPVTPSAAINEMLSRRCARKYNNAAAAGVAYAVCYVFHAINFVYQAMRRGMGAGAEMGDAAPSQRVWTAACAAVGGGGALIICLVYRIIIASAGLFHAAAYYTAMSGAIAFVALAAAGAMFFDKSPPAAAVSSRTSNVNNDKYK